LSLFKAGEAIHRVADAFCSHPSSSLPISKREKGRKGRQTYKLVMKAVLLTVLLIREIIQNVQNQPCVSCSCMPWELALHQQLPGRHQEVLDWTPR